MLAEDVRAPRVRFERVVQVTLINGSPRAYRLKSQNLSMFGMFLEMPMPIEQGTRVGLSLEASGQVLPFAEGVVVWQRELTNVSLARRAGFGVRFTGFSHPRSQELVRYLCGHIGSGRPLQLAPPRTSLKTHVTAATLVALFSIATFLAVTKLGVVEPASSEPMPQASHLAAVTAPPAVIEAAALEAAVEPDAAEPEPEHVVSLPSGAATALMWDGAHDEFRVAPRLSANAVTTKIYLLSDPPRLVFDISGAAPSASHSIRTTERFFSRIRVGRPAAQGTRVVVDLSKTPTSFLDESGAAIISF